MSGASEKLKKIFNKHYIPLFSNPATHRHRNWSTRKAAHPNTREAVYCMQPNAVRNIQTYISDKLNLTINKCMVQQRRAKSSGQDTAVHLYLKDKGQGILDRENR